MSQETIGFRPNDTDRRILAEDGRRPTEAIRHALRLLDHEHWLARFHTDAERLRDEDLNAEPETW